MDRSINNSLVNGFTKKFFEIIDEILQTNIFSTINMNYQGILLMNFGILIIDKKICR